jgi:hypothetical protein
MVESACAHLDEHFVCFDLRIRYFGVLKHSRTAVLMEDDCVHRLN